MYKDYRYINAGTNEVYRWGHKAQERALSFTKPNEKGYISTPVDMGKYWTIGTSNGKYGEFCKFGDTIFSVNSWGFAYAKAGTDKGDKLVKGIEDMVAYMKSLMHRNTEDDEEDEEEF